MTNPTDWTPDRDKAIKALIRETINAAGDIPADKLPHHLRATLKEQIEGNAMLDVYIAEILNEERKKTR